MVDGVLHARVAARAVDGAANDALTRLLAAWLGVASGRVAIIRGTTSRTKLVEVEGIDAGLVRSRWPGIAV